MSERFLALLVVFVMTVPVAGFAAQEPEEPKTDLQKFHRSVEEINAHAVNAGTKLRLGAMSLTPESKDAPATPAQLCCGNNLDKIAKQFQLLATTFGNLRSCYRVNGDAEGEVQLNFVHQDATSAYLAVQKFSGAKNAAELQGHYGNVARALLLLKKSAKDLTECAPSAAP